jgi:hypothetical protein
VALENYSSSSHLSSCPAAVEAHSRHRLESCTRLYVSSEGVVLAHWDLQKFSDILPAFNLCCPNGFLFPNLRIARFPLFHSTPIRIFLPTTLEKISLSCEPSHTSIPLLSAIPNLCPGLKDVSVTSWGKSDHVHRSISLLICALHGLVSLTTTAPDMAVISHVGQLSTLTKLDLQSLPESPALTPERSVPMFRHLRQLRVSAITVGQVTGFLAAQTLRWSKSTSASTHVLRSRKRTSSITS